jgi:hypothetical protein
MTSLYGRITRETSNDVKPLVWGRIAKGTHIHVGIKLETKLCVSVIM